MSPKSWSRCHSPTLMALNHKWSFLPFRISFSSSDNIALCVDETCYHHLALPQGAGRRLRANPGKGGATGPHGLLFTLFISRLPSFRVNNHFMVLVSFSALFKIKVVWFKEKLSCAIMLVNDKARTWVQVWGKMAEPQVTTVALLRFKLTPNVNK